jgi:uncharacterized membrane protein YhaH (DUF805 family)
MNFGQAIASGFQKYVTFSERAPRSEFWYWALFVFLVSILTNIVDFVMFPSGSFGPVSGIWQLAVFLPGLAVSIRRLHDVDRSGWWFLLIFTIIGALLLLYWDCVRGTSGPNRFGPDPLAGMPS